MTWTAMSTAPSTARAGMAPASAAALLRLTPACAVLWLGKGSEGSSDDEVLLRFGPGALPAIFVHDVRDCGPFSGGTKNLRAVEALLDREPRLREHYTFCRGPPAAGRS